jgi:hypothetical protein
MQDMQMFPALSWISQWKEGPLDSAYSELKFEENFPHILKFVEKMTSIPGFKDILIKKKTAHLFTADFIQKKEGKLQLYLPIKY